MTYYIKNAQELAAKVEAEMRAQPGHNFVAEEIFKRIESGLEVGHVFRGARYEGDGVIAKIDDKGDVVDTMELGADQLEKFATMALEAAAVGAAKRGYGF